MPTRDRIDLRVSARSTPSERRELGAFARYCIERIEREFGDLGTWSVSIEPSLDGHTSEVIVRRRGLEISARGTGHDGPLAMWVAMCRLEEKLRAQPWR